MTNFHSAVAAVAELVKLIGSLMAYLKGPIGLSDADIETLRRRYLTP